jgi:hypothetical protein
MADDDLGEDVAEVGGHGEIARVIALLARQAGPLAVNASAAYRSSGTPFGIS